MKQTNKTQKTNCANSNLRKQQDLNKVRNHDNKLGGVDLTTSVGSEGIQKGEERYNSRERQTDGHERSSDLMVDADGS
jgi:2-polyprenyl-6-methoxyphenol hydroxylase-like FAD-dependent oxidoreductase